MPPTAGNTPPVQGKLSAGPRNARIWQPVGRHQHYCRDVQEVWIALDARTRRLNWWWADVMAVVFVAASCLPLYLTQRHHRAPAAESWSWPGALGALGLAVYVLVVVRGCGRTKLSSDGMRLHFFFNRRFIAWDDITEIEKHSHTTRHGTYWDVRVHLVCGRKRHVPGAFTLNGRRRSVRMLDEQLEIMRSYWKAANQGRQTQ